MDQNNQSKNEQKNSKDSVLNFKFTQPDKNKSRTVKEVPLSSVRSLPEAEATGTRIGGCGASFSGSHAGTGYFQYPNDTIDLSSMVEGSTISVNVDAIGVPNRFTIYSASTGYVVASSPWMGYGNYSGPWGPSLNTSTTGVLTFTTSNSSLYLLKVETSTSTTSDAYSASVSCTAPSFISKVYAGVTINYYASTGLLQFNNATDFATVLDTLDASYETYNANYENQYPTLTPVQLDCVDLINNFDEFTTFRQFERLFSGFSSKPAQIEGVENTWLANNMTGMDPDSIDRTFDDAENAVANANYKVIVGTVTYDLSDSSGGGSTARLANFRETSSGGCSITYNPSCFTNKRAKLEGSPSSDLSRKFKLKVGIHAWCIRTGVKGKVVYFKQKNGNWKRARMKMAVFVGGNIYDNQCSSLNSNFSYRNPSSGYKNRKQLKVASHAALQTWKTKHGELGSSFDTQIGYSGTISL